jgi:hypothetical protein
MAVVIAGGHRRIEGAQRETGDDGRRLVASELDEEDSEHALSPLWLLHQRQRVGPRRTGGVSPISKPGPPRRPIGDQRRLAHQGVQQIQHGLVIHIIKSKNPAGVLEIESAREHRTAF